MKYTYTAVFTDNNGKIYARVLDLDGCITTGNDLADAMEQMKDAMSAWLCTAEDENIAIPAPTTQDKIVYGKGDVLSLITADTVKYRSVTDTRTIKKNVSIPVWLSELADKQHVNYSQVLQEALQARL